MNKTYSCGDNPNEDDIGTEKIDIRMSDIYSISSLESKRVRDYLKSFSQTSVEIKDSLKCLYHLKQKCEKKCKLYRNMKPYIKDQVCDKPSHFRSSIHTLEHFESPVSPLKQSQNSSFEQTIKEQMKDPTNTTSLMVKNPNGTTTEVTLKPIVLMHVRELPPDSEASNQQIHQLGPNTHSLCRLKTSQVVPKISESQSSVNFERQNHSNTNLLRVKSSHNCTDLSSERERSYVQMSSTIFCSPQNFKKPSLKLYDNSRHCIKTKMSIVNFPTCQRLCYKEHRNSVCGYSECLEAFLSNLQENKERPTAGVSSNEHVPVVNYSVTTFFRQPLICPSSTSSGFIKGDINLGSDMEMK